MTWGKIRLNLFVLLKRGFSGIYLTTSTASAFKDIIVCELHLGNQMATSGYNMLQGYSGEITYTYPGYAYPTEARKEGSDNKQICKSFIFTIRCICLLSRFLLYLSGQLFSKTKNPSHIDLCTYNFIGRWKTIIIYIYKIRFAI